MKLEIKKIIKISSILLIFIVVFLYIYISITSFNKNDIQAKGLVLLSETSDIRSVLSEYHLKYGEYPKTSDDVSMNEKYLCNYLFTENKCNSGMIFKNYNNNFIYEKNTDGLDYSIKFSTSYDNNELGCVHDKKSKKKGCSFKINSSGMTVEK